MAYRGGGDRRRSHISRAVVAAVLGGVPTTTARSSSRSDRPESPFGPTRDGGRQQANRSAFKQPPDYNGRTRLHRRTQRINIAATNIGMSTHHFIHSNRAAGSTFTDTQLTTHHYPVLYRPNISQRAEPDRRAACPAQLETTLADPQPPGPAASHLPPAHTDTLTENDHG